jgi:hypothetical protein
LAQLSQGQVPALADLLALAGQQGFSTELTQHMMQHLAALGPQGELRARQLSLALAQNTLRSATGELMTSLVNAMPESSQAQMVLVRTQALQQNDQALQTQLEQLLAADPSHGGAVGRQNRPVGFDEMRNRLAQGEIPALNDLVDSLTQGIALESPQVQAGYQQYLDLLEPLGAPGQLRAQQLGVGLQLAQLNGVTQSLGLTASQVAPASPQAQGVHSRLNALEGMRAHLSQELSGLLAQDPSQGQALQPNLPGTGQPPQAMAGVVNLFQQMQGLLRQILR